MELEKPPIFIVGCPRSGTTLLRLVIHSHPNIVIPPENRFMWAVYFRRLYFGDLKKEKNRRRLARWIINYRRKRFEDLKIDPDLWEDEAAKASPTIGSVVSTLFRIYARKYHKPRWGDKRPNYIRGLQKLLTIFPTAKIIHIIRDGRSCVASLKKMKWWKKGSIGAIARWVEVMNKAEKARRTYSVEQYYEIQYEELVKNPEKTLRKLCNFIDEDFDPLMLNHVEVSHTVPKRLMRDHSGTTKAVYKSAIDKWRNELELWEISLLQKVGGHHLEYWKYSLVDSDFVIPYRKWLHYKLRAWFETLELSLYFGIDHLFLFIYNRPIALVPEKIVGS